MRVRVITIVAVSSSVSIRRGSVGAVDVEDLIMRRAGRHYPRTHLKFVPHLRSTFTIAPPHPPRIPCYDVRNADGTDNFFVSSPKKKQQKVRPQCNRIEYYSFKCFSFISIEINFESQREVSLICSTYFSLHSLKKNTSYTYSILINLTWFLPNFVFQGNRLDSLMSSDSYFLFCLMLHLVA